MTKTKQPNYHIFKSSLLSVKKLKAFVIKKRVKNLTYELKLSQSIKIHFLISMIHLKQALNDEFKREFIIVGSDSIIINDENHYIIKKIIKIETQNNKPKFMMK